VRIIKYNKHDPLKYLNFNQTYIKTKKKKIKTYHKIKIKKMRIENITHTFISFRACLQKDMENTVQTHLNKYLVLCEKQYLLINRFENV